MIVIRIQQRFQLEPQLLFSEPFAPLRVGMDERNIKAWMSAANGSWRKRAVHDWTPEETGAWLSSHGGGRRKADLCFV